MCKCEICGDELDTQEEIDRGVCCDCDTTLLHDIHEEHELL